MPPKVERKAVINIKPEDLILRCEWQDCTEIFNCVDTFTQHVGMHLTQHLNNTAYHESVIDSDPDTCMQCLWNDCNNEIDGGASDYLRHVYFHAFHVKIKCIGALLLERTGRPSCLYDSTNRNLIPDLPECLQCGWDQCHVRFENAELFYRHVQSHVEGYPDGNSVEGGCKCLWQGCSVVVKSRHKLKDHCKSHTQEKLVACPKCGALFSCRTKFFDHLSRQQGYSTGKQYQCSHCNSMFAAERLLRDHMRYHINQYKCPFCDMTSPSPSNMRLHIRYRHSQDKPFKCDDCDYRCKSMADLKKHMETHNIDEDSCKCEVPGCSYKGKNYKNLEQHFNNMHQKSNASYECHVCSEKFARGALLTTHLKKKHKFNWPAGHSRFRYKRHSDGKFRLQTVRYESVELTTPEETSLNISGISDHSNGQVSDQVNGQVSDQVNGQVNGQVCDMPEIIPESYSPKTTDDGIVVAEKEDGMEILHTNLGHKDVCFLSLLDADPGKTHEITQNLNTNNNHNDKLVELTEGEYMNIENMSSNIAIVVQDTEVSPNKRSYKNKRKQVESENHYDTEEPIEIRIIANEAGEYMVENEMSGVKEAVSKDVQEQMELEEETMYNLQMLGDVALQDKYQDSKSTDN